MGKGKLKMSAAGVDDDGGTAKRSSSIGGDEKRDDDGGTAKRSSSIGGDEKRDDDGGTSKRSDGDEKRDDDYSHLLAYLDEEYDDGKEILELEFPRHKELDKLPVFTIELLDKHIKTYNSETDLRGLEKRIRADRYHQDFWFKELGKVWTGKETPLAATRLIVKVFDEIYEGHPFSGDVQGFLEHYGLPSYWDFPLPSE